MPGSRNLPTGTVTFVFTDIEGSTRLLDRLGDAYRGVLEDHQRIVRRALGARGGVEVSTEGDSFFLVFPGAAQAVGTAVEIQRGMAAHRWPDGEAVRLRIGVHTGDAELGGDDYMGVDVHRAARIAAAGHGGQVVVSAATRALVEGTEGLSFKDLGEHRLKDLPRTEHLHQVVAESLEEDFPPLRSMDARPNNLPPQLTSFIGRRRELEDVKEALAGTRLLTLTGPGGAGKTRLGLQAAAELLPSFHDGAFFVALASITESDLVMAAVAEALSLRDTSGRPAIEVVAEHLAAAEVLLVLDNFEQVLAAAPEVGQLLTATERARVLVTSREGLGLHGEREYPVPPLNVPDAAHLPPLDALSQYEAVALFLERARGVRPDFRVTETNAPAIAEVCARLDGLPLAIELAAARVKILSPQAMLTRLERSMEFLSQGARDLPARQRTLRGAIGWSYELLEAEERTLFARLGAFVGGATLEAAEAVCGPGLGIDVLEGMASLTNKSLLRQREDEVGESRFLMLETIREYAMDRLEEHPEEAAATYRRHVAHYLELAERAEPNLTGRDQIHWLDRIAADHDNFRAALSRAPGLGDLEAALQMAGALWRFWQIRGHLPEAADRLRMLLAAPGADEVPEARARALEASGGIAYWMGDTPTSRRAYQECLDIRRRLGERRGIARALYNLSFPYTFAQGVSREPERARALLEESLELYREVGDQRDMAAVLWGVGDLLFEEGRFEEAEPYLQEALERQRATGDRFGEIWSLFVLGLNVLRLRRTDEAEEHLRASLSLISETNDVSGVPLLLTGFGAVAAQRGDPDRAVRLAAAAERVQTTQSVGLGAVNEDFERWLEERLRVVPAEESQRLQAEGAAMTLDEAVAYALEAPEAPAVEGPREAE